MLSVNAVDDKDAEVAGELRSEFVRSVVVDGERGEENTDDIDVAVSTAGISAVKNRSNVMSKEEYCAMVRKSNRRHRELIIEIIHRLYSPDASPMQIYLTEPAGSGKTFLLRLAMETYNRYTVQYSTRRDPFVACVSTGKAAVNLDGTTAHSAFRIALSKQQIGLTTETLHSFRSAFKGVRCVIVDEVSMIGADEFVKIHARLGEITGVHDKSFGGLDAIFTGDFRQLPPANATPVYKSPKLNLGGDILWQYLDYYPLTEVMRQADRTFSGILTKIANGEPLDKQETELIESRFHTVDWCRENVTHTVRLFHEIAKSTFTMPAPCRIE